MYGTETESLEDATASAFENDVKMYGTETEDGTETLCRWFENDVKMYGTETNVHVQSCK